MSIVIIYPGFNDQQPPPLEEIPSPQPQEVMCSLWVLHVVSIHNVQTVPDSVLGVCMCIQYKH